MLQVRSTDDVEEYAAAALAFLEAAPSERNVLRSIVESARAGQGIWSAPPAWFWVDEDGATVGAASWTPPHRLLVSSHPAEAAPLLAAAVRDVAQRRARRLPGVNGPPSAAHAFAGAWRALTGEGAETHMRLLLHELTAVTDPFQPRGSTRCATSSDTDLLAAWLVAFVGEARATLPPDPLRAVEQAVGRGTLHVWEDGAVVSMTGCVLPVAGVARVGPVYTPVAHRNRGYGRALVAAVSRRLLDGGADRCVLFTDQSNPVSNAIYRQVGYVPIGEMAELRFLSSDTVIRGAGPPATDTGTAPP
jgi:predicted GNAT family acetyltransferase